MRPLRPLRWLALGFLWLQVAGLFAVVALIVEQAGAQWWGWLSALEAFLLALALCWWAVLFARITVGRVVTTKDGVWRSLLGCYPWLSALRYSLWGLQGLALLSGAAPEANPYALAGLLGLWWAGIFVSNQTYRGLLLYTVEPGREGLKAKLLEWLNVSAALSFALLVLNLWPIPGYSQPQMPLAEGLYALVGFSDVLGTVLAWLTLRRSTGPLAPLPSAGEA